MQDTSEDEQRALLARAGSGDQDAVRRLYRLHVDRVFGTVRRILGPHDGDVDDVVQQTFLAAIDGASGFDGRSRVSGWLLGIATRRALDHARARWRRGRWQRMRDQLGEWVGLGTGMGRPESRPDDVHDARSIADRALATLTPDQRTAFVLYEVEGHTLAEISEMTGARISTLHARLGAARKRLDAMLETIGELEPQVAEERSQTRKRGSDAG